jgi:hypothetical protein
MITVSKKALMDKEDDGSDVGPEVGDVVDLGGVKATVKAMDGDNCSLSIDSINGESCRGYKEDAEAKEDGDEDMAADDESDGMGLAGVDMPKDKAGLALRRKVAGMDKRRMA